MSLDARGRNDRAMDVSHTDAASEDGTSSLCRYCPEPGATVPVALVHSASGSGWSQYAHPECVKKRSAAALLERFPVVPLTAYGLPGVALG